MTETRDYRLPTPDWTWSATVTTKDGVPHDITRELAVIYDAIVKSMDWGSGFLDREDAEAILRIGSLCGFESAEYTTTDYAVPILLDAQGEPLSATTDKYGGVRSLSGYGDMALTARGHVARARGIAPFASGVVVALRLLDRKGALLGDYPLDEPLEVVAGRSVTVEGRISA